MGSQLPTSFEPVPPRDRVENTVVVPPALRLASEWAWRLVVVVAALYLLERGLAPLSGVLIPVLVALLLTVLLRPLAQFFLRRLRFPRFLAAVVTVLLAFVVVAGLLTLAGTQIASGITDLARSAQRALATIEAWLTSLSILQNKDLVSQATGRLQSLLSTNSSDIFSGALTVTTTAGSFVVGLLICLFATVFFLGDGARIWTWMVRLLPRGARYRTHEASERGWLSLTSYVRAQIIVAAVDAIGITLVAALLGLPFVVPILLIVFFSSFIPIVGAFVSGSLAVLVALFSGAPRLGEWGLTGLDKPAIAALIMLGGVLVVHEVESHVLQPFLMGGAVRLHPLAIILAVAVGATLLGIPGALFSVPFAAVVNSVVLYLSGNEGPADLHQSRRLAAMVNPFEPSGLLRAGVAEKHDETPDGEIPEGLEGYAETGAEAGEPSGSTDSSSASDSTASADAAASSERPYGERGASSP